MSTPIYPVNTAINGINPGLFPFHVSSKVFKEYVKLFPFYHMMGEEMTRPIVRHQMKSGEGYMYTEAKLNALDFTKPVYNFDQVSGSGQYQKVDSMNVVCRGVSFEVPIKGRQLIALGTPINLPDAVRPQLVEVCKRALSKNILDAAMFDYLAPTTTSNSGYAIATQLPSYDRMLMAGMTPTRTTYNAYTGITYAWATMNAGITYLQNGLSAKHLLSLKAMAVRGGNSNGAALVNGDIEDAIRPAFLTTKGGYDVDDYIYLCNTESYMQLLQDPMYYMATTTRGVVVTSDQPEAISGADYHGKYMGIHIYEVKDLSRYIATSQTNGYSIGWELFIGAGAWSAGWHEELSIAFHENTIDRIQQYATHEIRGEASLRFPAKQATTVANIAKTPAGIEQGLIHSFVRIA